jgi:hypothetical protein
MMNLKSLSKIPSNKSKMVNIGQFRSKMKNMLLLKNMGDGDENLPINFVKNTEMIKEDVLGLLCILEEYSDLVGVSIPYYISTGEIIKMLGGQIGCSMMIVGEFIKEEYFNMGGDELRNECMNWRYVIEMVGCEILGDEKYYIGDIRFNKYGVMIWWGHPNKSKNKVLKMVNKMVEVLNKEYNVWGVDKVHSRAYIV